MTDLIVPRRHRTRRHLVRTVLLALALAAAAVRPAGAIDYFDQFGEIVKDPATVRVGSVIWDNDAFYLTGRATDQFYTNGFLLERKYVGQGYYRYDTATGKFLRQTPDQLGSWQPEEGFANGLFRQAYAVHFGQNIYTASDIELPPGKLDPHDRPYAAWLFLGIYREVVSDSNAWVRYGFDVGILGPSALGEEVQKAVHKIPILHAAQPQAWDTQIRNEWGLQLFAEHTPFAWSSHYNVDWSFLRELGLELSPDLMVNMGNIFVNAQASLRFRFGQFDPCFKRPYHIGGADPQSKPPQLAPRHRREYYLFWNLTGHAVGYNGTISGRKTALTPQVHEEPLVYDTEFGGVYHGRDLYLSYSLVVRSSEVKEESSKFPQHRFGRITVNWEY